MSLLNKFISPELKIKPKNRKKSTAPTKMRSKPTTNIISTVKSGLSVSASYNSFKSSSLGGGAPPKE